MFLSILLFSISLSSVASQSLWLPELDAIAEWATLRGFLSSYSTSYGLLPAYQSLFTTPPPHNNTSEDVQGELTFLHTYSYPVITLVVWELVGSILPPGLKYDILRIAPLDPASPTTLKVSVSLHLPTPAVANELITVLSMVSNHNLTHILSLRKISVSTLRQSAYKALSLHLLQWQLTGGALTEYKSLVFDTFLFSNLLPPLSPPLLPPLPPSEELALTLTRVFDDDAPVSLSPTPTTLPHDAAKKPSMAFKQPLSPPLPPLFLENSPQDISSADGKTGADGSGGGGTVDAAVGSGGGRGGGSQLTATTAYLLCLLLFSSLAAALYYFQGYDNLPPPKPHSLSAFPLTAIVVVPEASSAASPPQEDPLAASPSEGSEVRRRRVGTQPLGPLSPTLGSSGGGVGWEGPHKGV